MGKPCPFFAKGHCNNGDKCEQSHGNAKPGAVAVDAAVPAAAGVALPPTKQVRFPKQSWMADVREYDTDRRERFPDPLEECEV